MSFILVKLSVLDMSTKNNAHWHSNKKLSINEVSKSPSILISYKFKFNVLFSKSIDILFVVNAIYYILILNFNYHHLYVIHL